MRMTRALQASRLPLRPTLTSTSSILRTNHARPTVAPAASRAVSPVIPFGAPMPALESVNVRTITQQHRRRMREAELEWQQQADAIEQKIRPSFLTMLEQRGLVNNVIGVRDNLDKLLTRKRIGLYAGVDPTAPSLHIGHMLPFIIIGWAYVYGYRAHWLLGGTTASIGDPTDRHDQRPELANATRKANMANMHMQMKKLGNSVERYAAKYGYERDWAWRRVLVNNNTWWLKKPFSEVAKLMMRHVRIGPMLGRDSFKNRIESKEGMTFAEFAYPIMQAWDWWELYRNDCLVQVGGSDQEGNIRFGADTIMSMIKSGVAHEVPEEKRYAPVNPIDNNRDIHRPMGITTPILTTAKGQKIGKSAGNAIWLDPDMTPVLEFYQHFLHTSDEDVERYLKMFTFMPLSQIGNTMKKHREDPSKCYAQNKLAFEFTELIHGTESAKQAMEQVSALSKISTVPMIDDPELVRTQYASTDPARHSGTVQANPFNSTSFNLILPRSLVVGQYFHKVLWSAGLADSKKAAYQLIVSNGAAVASRPDSNKPMDDAIAYVPIRPWPADVTEGFISDGDLMILRAGKWKVKIIKIVPDEEYEKLGLSCPGWKEHYSPEERSQDEALVRSTGRIAGHRVKLPRFARDDDAAKKEREARKEKAQTFGVAHWVPGQGIVRED